MLGFYFDRKLEQEQEPVFLWWTGNISSCFHGSKEDISDERSPVVMCEASITDISDTESSRVVGNHTRWF